MNQPPALLLDTHVALWLDAGDSRLRPATVSRIEAVRSEGGTIYIHAVSAWELALLIDLGRVRMGISCAGWVGRMQAMAGVELMPLTVSAAAAAYEFHGFGGRDPADRLLMAAAAERGCPLVTCDRAILEFARRQGYRYRLEAVN